MTLKKDHKKEVKIIYSIYPHTPDYRIQLERGRGNIFKSTIIGVELEDKFKEIEERLNKCIN